MALLKDREQKVQLEIKLIKNEFLILDEESDYEKWIPFEFTLNILDEVYFLLDKNPTFSLFEIQQFILTIKQKVNEKKTGIFITPYTFFCSEAFFDIFLDETLEENELEISLWLREYPVHKGYRFIVNTNDLEKFVLKLGDELLHIS